MFILKTSVAIFVLIHVIVVIYRRYNNLYFKTTELLLSGKNAKIWGDFCESVWDICDKASLGIILLYHKCPRQIHKNHRPLLGILLLRVSILNLKVCYHDKPFCRDENFLAFDSILAVYYSFASSIPTFVQNIGLLLVICFIALKSSYKKRGDVLF